MGYRVGRRAVVAGSEGFVKVVRPKRLDALVRTHRWLASAHMDVETPQLMKVDATGAIEISAVAGTSMHNVLRHRSFDEHLCAAVDMIAVALAELHATTAPDDLSIRTPDQPERWIETVNGAEPARCPGLAQVAERLPALPSAPAAVTHGDLHDKNVFLHTHHVGLIDLDSVAWGAPEDDIANLAVHLQLRALQGSQPVSVADELVARLIERSEEHRRLSRDRLVAATAHTWFRLACIYCFRSASRHLVPELLRRCAEECE